MSNVTQSPGGDASHMAAIKDRIGQIRTRLRRTRAVMDACSNADPGDFDPPDVFTHLCETLDSIYDDLNPEIVLSMEEDRP